ncbi:MAG: hypothetical protein ATN36_02210 [Epulopiscium sp. Nele67-Bin005]|nr:MAG: hypothetical protein ATN36_02210 [Epulopiscium sp. Nele67-Bin005]
MKNELIIYTPIKQLPGFEADFNIELENIFTKIKIEKGLLYKGTLTSIQNQIKDHTFYDDKRNVFYFRIQGVHKILRTKDGISRIWIYQGIENIISESNPITIMDNEYISFYDLLRLFEFKRLHTKGKTRLYVLYAKTLIEALNDLTYVENLRLCLEDTSKLKAKKIKEENITSCQFSGKVFTTPKEVEFAHINSKAAYPFLALELNNGVIILKEIHKEITKLNLNTIDELYNFCKKNNYNTDWIYNACTP